MFLKQVIKYSKVGTYVFVLSLGAYDLDPLDYLHRTPLTLDGDCMRDHERSDVPLDPFDPHADHWSLDPC